MQITDILARMGGLQAVARELGVSESQAASEWSASARVGGARPDAAAQGLASILDLNGDGNSLDDILRRAGKAFR